MTLIQEQDFIESIADALQFISYYHPQDFILPMHKAYVKEQSQAAKDAMAQILINSKMSAVGKRPLCQDTGIVTCFVVVGMQVKWARGDCSVEDLVNQGVQQAYTNPHNPLESNLFAADPAGKRINTKDNAPAVVHVELVPGDQVEVMIAAKGGGSENS